MPEEIVVTAPRHWLREPEAFYASVRKITGQLDDIQADTIKGLLVGDWPIGFVAYGLATPWHECRLRPLHELGGRAYLSKYDTGKLAKDLGNTPEADGEGIKYAGRGLVQLTGRRNYKAAGEYLGIDLLGNPDLALEPSVAAEILVWGMETGAFTGKKLRDYIVDRGNRDAFVRCRRIINGSDRAELIAGYADRFQEALDKGQWK